MKFTQSNLRFKQQFKSLNYYSMPRSILFVVRKRLNLLFYVAFVLSAFLITIV